MLVHDTHFFLKLQYERLASTSAPTPQKAIFHVLLRDFFFSRMSRYDGFLVVLLRGFGGLLFKVLLLMLQS